MTTRCDCCSEPAIARVDVDGRRYAVCESCARMLTGRPLSTYGVDRADEREREGRRRRGGGKGRWKQ